jgi:hypothetical protein
VKFPQPTFLVGFEIFRRCGGLRAIPTLSSFMNLGQHDFWGETWSNFDQVWGNKNALVVIRLCNFGGGFSMFFQLGGV